MPIELAGKVGVEHGKVRYIEEELNVDVQGEGREILCGSGAGGIKVEDGDAVGEVGVAVDIEVGTTFAVVLITAVGLNQKLTIDRKREKRKRDKQGVQQKKKNICEREK